MGYFLICLSGVFLVLTAVFGFVLGNKHKDAYFSIFLGLSGACLSLAVTFSYVDPENREIILYSQVVLFIAGAVCGCGLMKLLQNQTDIKSFFRRKSLDA